VRPQFIAVLIALAFAFAAQAESAKVLKVLPHYLDAKGRHTLHPSLFERDAYQAELRADPEKRAALRFDVQWKARGHARLTLRIEAKGGQTNNIQPLTLEQTVRPGTFSKWTELTIAGEEFRKFGNLISWRATLLDGTNVVAEEKSFLW
jgi:hypothetical protein